MLVDKMRGRLIPSENLTVFLNPRMELETASLAAAVDVMLERIELTEYHYIHWVLEIPWGDQRNFSKVEYFSVAYPIVVKVCRGLPPRDWRLRLLYRGMNAVPGVEHREIICWNHPVGVN